MPYDTLVAYDGQTRAATLTDERLADYGANHARYQAVILATGDLGHQVPNPDGTTSYLSALTDAEWATLANYERTFGIRRLSDYTAATAAHGLAPVAGAPRTAASGSSRPPGAPRSPYLKGPVAIADDDPARPRRSAIRPAGRARRLADAARRSRRHGVSRDLYAPDDGREEMVMTVASNQFQNHNQLLRHGMLNWVTRGVFLGYERNYLGLHIDDLFLGDDAWDPATHTTSYDPARASRMTPGDVDRAIAWSRGRGLRLDMAFNGGGSALAGDGDPLTAKFADPAVRDAFGYINHTLRPPEPGLLDELVHHPPDHRQPVLGARPRAAGRAPTSSSPASTPAWPTPGRATRARSTRRRSTTSSRWPPAARSPPAPTTTR